MAGTIALSLTQQFNVYGQPLSGGLLYLIQAGTVSTPQNGFQDTALTIPLPNPITLDAAGRIPQFFLADGNIKVRLQDSVGVVQLAADNILVIGPSAGGGGGASVDPTTLIQTGMVAVYYGVGALAGYVRANGFTIGSPTSSATERANSDCNALFLFLWNADPNLVVSGGRGANAAADWAANKQIILPDWRGRAIAGLSDMGNTNSGRLSASYWGGSGIVLGQTGGTESNTLVAANSVMPQHQHDVFIRDPNHLHTAPFSITATGYTSGGLGPPAVGGTSNTSSVTTGVTIGSVSGVGANDNKTALSAAAAAATPHANVQPTMLATIYLKL